MQIVDILQLLVPNVWTALTQLCATAILFFLMYKLAWKPVKKILDTRSQFEQEKLDKARALEEENQKINDQAQDIISKANSEADRIIEEAHAEGDEIKNELIEEGRNESKMLIENAKRDVQLQKSKMMTDMHSQIVDAAMVTAEKMLQSKLDTKEEDESINSFVKEVIDK